MLKEWFRGARGRGTRVDGPGGKLERYLSDGDACALLRLVLENPGITAGQLDGRAGMGHDTVAAWLKKLADDGLIVTECEAGQAGFHIAAGAKAAVVERLPLNYQCPGLRRE
ncbi:MAG: hypothetical protein A4E28_01268 [Methanocella sp. PtaU1.Bin125]|nr:MAG: hypothetical protein A4E28_01268 [Methanocella sp. PtaU1.Bin125]